MLAKRRRRVFGYAKPSLGSKLFSVERSSLIAEFLCQETTGTVAIDSSPAAVNGAYTSVSLNATTYRGQPIPSFTTSSVLTFTNAILGTKGTLFIVGRVSAVGVWTDTTLRYMMRLQVDANNLLHVIKSNTNNTIGIRFRAGGTEKTISIATSTVDFYKLIVTWGDSANGNAINAWFNGVAQTPQTTFGAFTGTITTKTFGEASANGFTGNLGRIAVWNTILDAADIALLNAA